VHICTVTFGDPLARNVAAVRVLLRNDDWDPEALAA
jgi:hypothetical protein